MKNPESMPRGGTPRLLLAAVIGVLLAGGCDRTRPKVASPGVGSGATHVDEWWPYYAEAPSDEFPAYQGVRREWLADRPREGLKVLESLSAQHDAGARVVYRSVLLRRLLDDPRTAEVYLRESAADPRWEASRRSNRAWNAMQSWRSAVRAGDQRPVVTENIRADLEWAAEHGETMAILNMASAQLFVGNLCGAESDLSRWEHRRDADSTPISERAVASALHAELLMRRGNWAAAAEKFTSLLESEGHTSADVYGRLCAGVVLAGDKRMSVGRVHLDRAMALLEESSDVGERGRKIVEAQQRVRLHLGGLVLTNPGATSEDRVIAARIWSEADAGTWHGLLCKAAAGDRSVDRVMKSIPKAVRGAARADMMTQAALAGCYRALGEGNAAEAGRRLHSAPPPEPGSDALDGAVRAVLEARVDGMRAR